MKFSVFVPTYNRHSSLIYTLRSICSQTYDDYEVFIVDRGSEPPVEDIVRQCNNPRFHSVLSNQQNHICDDAEKILSEMTGDIFIFLADDDVLLPEAFQIVRFLFDKFRDVEFISSGYGIYNFKDSSVTLPVDFSGNVFSYQARAACYHFLCGWGIGVKKKYPAPQQSHSSLTFLKKNLIDRTRSKQRALFVKSFGDIGYVGALANTNVFFHIDMPLGLLGAGHERETDGIINRFKHEKEMVFLEHVPNRHVACFENIGLDGHLKILYRNGLKQEYPPYLRPKAHSRQIKKIIMDSPFTVRTLRDVTSALKSWCGAALRFPWMKFFNYRCCGDLPKTIENIRYNSIDRHFEYTCETIEGVALWLQSMFIKRD